MLEVRSLTAGYDAGDVVHGASLNVQEGEAVMLVGSNGAGKTTLFRAMIGMLTPKGGQVVFDGDDVTGLPAQKMVRRGVGFVPAERHLFPRMSVVENLSLGAYPNRVDSDTMDMVMSLFPRLAERKRQHAGTMSGGEQQMLAMGRALLGQPKLLILDEPTTGLAPKLAVEAYAALGELRKQGLTLLVAEQQVPLALKLCDRGYVLENGRIRLEGSSEELGSNPEVRRAYLGIS